MDDILTVSKLDKSFGDKKILDQVDLHVGRREIVGIIGRNGAGKTVLFKCICNLILPDSGSISCMAEKIGAIIEEPGFLPQYSGLHNLRYLAMLSGMRNVDFESLLTIVGLSDAGNKKVGKYSLGMKQRLGIAQAIMEKPDFLILDEPMNGLDNRGVEEIRQLLLNLQKKGVSILMASHNREDIEQLCCRTYQMDGGRIVR